MLASSSLHGDDLNDTQRRRDEQKWREKMLRRREQEKRKWKRRVNERLPESFSSRCRHRREKEEEKKKDEEFSDPQMLAHTTRSYVSD